MDMNEETGVSTAGRRQSLGVAGTAANAADNVTSLVFVAAFAPDGATR